MAKEVIIEGNSVEEAVNTALGELKAIKEECNIEIIEKGKKTLFGKVKEPAKVKVSLKEERIKVNVVTDDKDSNDDKPSNDNSEEKLRVAKEYLSEVLENLGLENINLTVTKEERGAKITVEADRLGLIIGKHGETLDALQYLTSLACNRVEGDYYRISVDGGNYREKREKALQELARKISDKVKRTGRSQTLEPMNPFERRIIHAAVTDIEGVSSKSKGEEPNRRVVIFSTDKSKSFPKGAKSGSYKKAPVAPERTMEQILKGEFSDEEKNTKLYSKIEL